MRGDLAGEFPAVGEARGEIGAEAEEMLVDEGGERKEGIERGS